MSEQRVVKHCVLVAVYEATAGPRRAKRRWIRRSGGTMRTSRCCLRVILGIGWLWSILPGELMLWSRMG